MIPPFKPQQESNSLQSQRVNGQYPTVVKGDIDRTRLVMADAPTDSSTAFSFLVVGDTDAGESAKDNQSFSHPFADQVMTQLQESRFLIHTGDVAYPIGSYRNYFTHFLHPYRALLVQLPDSPAYTAQDITFNKALLSVPGNHDYSCDATGFRAWNYLLRQLCDRLRKTTGIDLGHYGGECGEAYAQTFLDSLSDLSAAQLTAHLATHYSAKDSSHRTPLERCCLSYRPGTFTRLPNRYYSFRYGGIDFFALDSNTWNTDPHHARFDQAQLTWLEDGLIRSWQTPDTVGRIVYLHHSPYTTEACHWQKPETTWVRRHLRTVFNNVAIAVGLENAAREQHFTPTVDLVLSGHAHCLEHLKSSGSNVGEQGIDWVVCGGGGAEIRRQRKGEPDILESVRSQGRQQTQVVARSQRFVGRHGYGHKAKSFHSFIRVHIQPNSSQKMTVCPFIVSRMDNQWTTKPLPPLTTGRAGAAPQHEMHSV